ncbi:unnamed protein product [Prorocentrum cordatum]|uniref:Non-specific serine/threonine protein kinase n=1 Tax=Prorocentrum cordatum TaxID=2364126 RepID=A0ABN9YD78_9DINO|nr:unnamed protein product [Polarella glacialis]
MAVAAEEPAAAGRSDAARDAEFEELISSLRGQGEEELTRRGLEPMSVGFANLVCGAEWRGQRVVAKCYTDLVFLRVAPEAIGVADVHAGDSGIGPRVLHSSQRGLVMERLEGQTLDEPDMHRGDLDLLASVARALAALHQLPIPAACDGEPMLWRTMDKMMGVVQEKPELIPEGMPNLEAIREKVHEAKRLLQGHEPKVVFGHNDFKPSNVMLTEGGIKIIDFELSGPNYRGFDLMKVFRTAAGPSQPCMRHFLAVYAEQVGAVSSEAFVSGLLQEADRFEPLTWLEACVFFLTLPVFKPDKAARWNALALDRWAKFQQTLGKLRAGVLVAPIAGLHRSASRCTASGMRRGTLPGRPIAYDPQLVSEECVSLEELSALLAIEAEPPGCAAGARTAGDCGGWEVLDERGSIRVERWLPSSSESDELLIMRGTLSLRDVPVAVAVDQLHSLSARRQWDDHVSQLRRAGGEAGARRVCARDGLESEIIETETRPLFGVLPALKLTQWRALAWLGGAATVLYRDASRAGGVAGGGDAAEGGGLADAWGAWLSEIAAAACEPIRAKSLVIGQVIRRLDPISGSDGSRVFVYLQASVNATAWLLAQGVALDLIAASCDAYEAACRAQLRGPRPPRHAAEHRVPRTVPGSIAERTPGRCTRGSRGGLCAAQDAAACCSVRRVPPPQYFDIASRRGSVCSASTAVSGLWWAASAPDSAAAPAAAGEPAGQLDSPAEAAAGPRPATQADRTQGDPSKMAQELDWKPGEAGKPRTVASAHWEALGGVGDLADDCAPTAGTDGESAVKDSADDCTQSTADADGEPLEDVEPRTAAGAQQAAGVGDLADGTRSTGADGEPAEGGVPQAARGAGAHQGAPVGAGGRADGAQSGDVLGAGTEDAAPRSPNPLDVALDFLGGPALAGGGLLAGLRRTPRQPDTGQTGTPRDAAGPPLGRVLLAAPRRGTTVRLHGAVWCDTAEAVAAAPAAARGARASAPGLLGAAAAASPRQNPLALAVAVRRRRAPLAAGRTAAAPSGGAPLVGALRVASGSLGTEAAARAREQLLLEDAWLQGESSSPRGSAGAPAAARGGRARRHTRGSREVPEPPIPMDQLLTCCMPGAGAGIDVWDSARSPTASTAAPGPP